MLKHYPKFIYSVAVFVLLTLLGTINPDIAFAKIEGNPRFKMLFKGESPYYSILVAENIEAKKRFIKCNNHTQTVIRLEDPDFLDFAYLRSFVASLAFARGNKDILIGGLGGGSLARYISQRYPDARIDVVELDPIIVELAEKYFFFKKSQHMEVYTQDLRTFLRRNKKKYDIILIDTYFGDTIPFHLTTKEFLENVKEHLKPEGVVSGHYWASYANKYFNAQARTYQAVFKELYMLGKKDSDSYIFVAPRDKGQINKEHVLQRAVNISKNRKLNFDPAALLESEFNDATTMSIEAEVLTDDHAPVNILNIKKPAKKNLENEL